jgi:penicillin-binding protein 1C
VQGIIRAERAALDRIGAHNVAVVVLDNLTGEWLAWEGSGDYTNEDGGAIDGVSVARQPGSALKPFTYALAFERGESPATVLPDVPSYFPTGQDGVLYSPRNYDNRFRGPLLARPALAGSENVPAVALASRVGVPDLLRFLRDAGFTTFDKTASFYGLGVTLGDAEVRLDELVTAYAALARGGLTIQPQFMRRAANQASVPADARSRDARLVSTRTAFWISDILSDDDARSFAFGRGGSLEFPFKVAAKTGTSEGYHDNWAIGYTRAITVGVWVGNFDRRPLMNSSGVSGAGPIFHAVLLAAQERASGVRPHDELPATSAEPVGTVRRRVCALSGSAATPWCPVQVDEWVAADAPPHACDWHRVTPRGVVVDWPVEYQAWARTDRTLNQVTPANMPAVRLPEAAATPANAARRRAALRIANPPDGAVYLIDPTLRREFQTLPLRAVGSGPTDVEWSVDEQSVGQIDIASHIDWPLAPGRHVITARDKNGGQAGVSVTVK